MALSRKQSIRMSAHADSNQGQKLKQKRRSRNGILVVYKTFLSMYQVRFKTLFCLAREMPNILYRLRNENFRSAYTQL